MVGKYGSSSSPLARLAGSLRSRSGGSISTASSSSQAISPMGDDEPDSSAHLNVAERWWRVHQPWLEQCGYFLRPRYRQDWMPSWERKGVFLKLRTPEDTIELPVCFRRSRGLLLAYISFYDLGYVEEDRCYEVRWVPRSPSPRFGEEVPGSGGHSSLPHFWQSQ